MMVIHERIGEPVAVASIDELRELVHAVDAVTQE
jgi:hypothetical protein